MSIFLVISRCVIALSLLGRPSRGFMDFVIGFYERKIKRLVPSLSVSVLITSMAIYLLDPFPSPSLLTGVTSLFGLSNPYLLRESTDYFSQSTEEHLKKACCVNCMGILSRQGHESHGLVPTQSRIFRGALNENGR